MTQIRTSFSSNATKSDAHYKALASIPLSTIAKWRREWVETGMDKKVTFNYFRDKKMWATIKARKK